jgi:hypothetical protein
MTQFIVIVQILIAKRDAMDALSNQRLDPVLFSSGFGGCCAGCVK